MLEMCLFSRLGGCATVQRMLSNPDYVVKPKLMTFSARGMVASSNVALMHNSWPIRLRKLSLLTRQNLFYVTSLRETTHNAVPQNPIIPKDDALFLVWMCVNILGQQHGWHNPVAISALPRFTSKNTY